MSDLTGKKIIADAGSMNGDNIPSKNFPYNLGMNKLIKFKNFFNFFRSPK